MTTARDAFLARFGTVFENRPDLAAAAYDRGLPPPPHGAEILLGAFMAILHALPEDGLTNFLNGHPELAGAALAQGEITEDSAAEQGSAGLGALEVGLQDRFRALNAAYRSRFGFPFIMAVRGIPATDILTAFDARLGRDVAAERAEALRQVGRILLLRLRDRLGHA